MASGLRARGHIVITARDLGLLGERNDEVLLQRAVDLEHVLFTHNFADFSALAKDWSAAGRSFPGVLVAPMLPVGMLVRRLDSWLSDSQAVAGIQGRYDWLPRYE